MGKWFLVVLAGCYLLGTETLMFEMTTISLTDHILTLKREEKKSPGAHENHTLISFSFFALS